MQIVRSGEIQSCFHQNLIKAWKAKVRECELEEESQRQDAMNARRKAAKGDDFHKLERAIAEAWGLASLQQSVFSQQAG